MSPGLEPAWVLHTRPYRDTSLLLELLTLHRGRIGVVARGVEYRAEKLVASNADVHQTLIGLVGEEHLSPLWAKRAKDFRYGPSHVLATPMFCLYEAPAYRSARWDPEIDKCFYTVVGYDGRIARDLGKPDGTPAPIERPRADSP